MVTQPFQNKLRFTTDAAHNWLNKANCEIYTYSNIAFTDSSSERYIKKQSRSTSDDLLLLLGYIIVIYWFTAA